MPEDKKGERQSEKPQKSDKTDKKKAPPPQMAKPKSMAEVKIIRIAESDIEGNKKLEHALTKIKGISWSYARAIRKVLGFENKQIAAFTDEELEKVKDALSTPSKYNIPTWLYNKQKDPISGKNYHLLSSDLRLSNRTDIENLKKIKCYRGVRHIYNYKVRGQRTRSRGANVRGRVGTSVGVIKKKLVPQKSEEK